MNARSGAGGLFTTEIEAVDLGEHRGMRLEGRVERRVLRIGIGGRRGFRLELARRRPTAVQVSSPAGIEVRRIPANPDPWIATAQRLIALTVATTILPWLLRRAATAHRAGG